MKLKLAVASSDGKQIDCHFGRAERFLIFLVENGGYRYLETREAAPACDGGMHDDNRLETTVSLLADCQGVIASQIGPGAIDALVQRRILPFSIPGDLEAGVSTVVNSPRLRYLAKKAVALAPADRGHGQSQSGS